MRALYIYSGSPGLICIYREYFLAIFSVPFDFHTVSFGKCFVFILIEFNLPIFPPMVSAFWVLPRISWLPQDCEDILLNYLLEAL